MDLAGLRVVEGEVALAEGAPHGVLAGEPDRRAVDQQRGEGERLGVGPLDAGLRLVEGGQPALELLDELGVEREAGRRRHQRCVERAQRGGVDGGARLGRLPGGDRLLAAVELRLGVPAADRGLPRSEVLQGGRRPAVGFLGGDDARLHEARLVQLPDARVRGDRGRHQRLRVGRLVALVVPVAAIPDQVDHHVGVEALAIHDRQAGGGEAGLRIVGVDVDDRRVEPLGQVARVVGRAAVGRLGGKADLVVGDQVQRAAGAVAGQARHVEGLRHHPLRGEGRITVDQDRDGPIRVDRRAGRGAVRLLGAGVPFDHRVDRLEVARVRGERHVRARPRPAWCSSRRRPGGTSRRRGRPSAPGRRFRCAPPRTRPGSPRS